MSPRKRSAFLKSFRREGLDEDTEMTLYKSFSVMKSQVYSPEGIFNTMWTTPDRLPHKKIWLWDSVFHSFGNKHISKELAYDSIRAVLTTQEEDGFIPHMAVSTENAPVLPSHPCWLGAYMTCMNIFMIKVFRRSV